jgi:DNA-binding GntR family transcriptional regulator
MVSVLARPSRAFLQFEEPAGSLADEAYRSLLEQIITLQRLPGEVLIEEELRNQLKIGRTPIREALQRLAADRLVVVLPRRGTLVSEINIMDLGAIYEIRSELEGLAARLAAQRFPGDRVPPAVAAELADVATIDDWVQLIAIDRRLHKLVYHLAKNPYLEDNLERYLNLSARIVLAAIQRLASPPTHELVDAIGEFEGIFAAIATRDPQQAERLARHHTGFGETMIRAVV